MHKQSKCIPSDMSMPKLSLNDIDIKNEKIYIYIAYRHI